MKNLLRFILLAGVMAFAVPPVAFHEVITCAPSSYTFRATVSSVRDGNWSDPATWGGQLPGTLDQVSIQHSVTLDINTNIAGAEAQGVLSFKDNTSALLSSTGNIVITGSLQARPAGPGIVHQVRFTGIDETKMVGGGMDPVSTDVGLWVMGAGQLDIAGTKKTSWTRLISGVAVGATQITVKDAAGWRVGDEISIVPTAAGDYTGFEDRTITAIAGNVITLNAALTRAHPQVNGKWTAEVMNLTRNVRIEGTAAGRSHIFIRSTKPQLLQYAQLRYLGPRKQQGGDAATEAVLGRYGLHLHHNMNGSRGTIVQGCVARDIGNNVFVPHVSHGVRMLDNIAYNILGSGFWWDEGYPESSHDIAWLGNIVAKCNFVPRSINVFDGQGDPTGSARAFMLNHGDNDTCMYNVAVGVSGDPHDGGGFKWEAVNNSNIEGVWHFLYNLSHNISAAGAITWQNVQMNHQITGFTAFNCTEGIFHGAYANPYRYDSTTLFNAPLIVHAASSTIGRIRFENSTFEDVEIQGSPLGGAAPILFRNCTMRNFRDVVSSPRHDADLVQCTITGTVTSGADLVRVQPAAGQPYKVQGGKTNIEWFAPGVWGDGNGLKATYYATPNFSNPVFTRIDNVIAFSEWGNGVHYLVNKNSFSLVEEGFFQAQFTEQYKITASGPGTVRLYINHTLQAATATLNLEAGKWYPIRIEYSKSNTQRGGLELKWRSNSLDRFKSGGEYIPTSQLCVTPPTGLPIRDPIPRDPTIILNDFKVYPTYTSGVFRVESPRGRHEYQVTNVYGQQLEKGIIPSNSIITIDLSRYAAGMYFFGVNGRWWKVIKQ